MTLEWATAAFGFTRSENQSGRNNLGSLGGTGLCCSHFSSSCQWVKKGLRKRWRTLQSKIPRPAGELGTLEISTFCFKLRVLWSRTPVGAVGHSGITVVIPGWFSLHLSTLKKPESHSSVNFERQKKSFAGFESRENNFLCLGVCVFCSYKGLLEQQQQMNQQTAGRPDGKLQFPSN